MNYTPANATTVSSPSKAAYLFWQDGVPGMDAAAKSVGPAIGLKVKAGDHIDMETWVRYQEESSFTDNPDLGLVAQILGGGLAYHAGFEALTQAQSVNIFAGALQGFPQNVDDAIPYAYLNYIIFNEDYEPVEKDRRRVDISAGFPIGQEGLANNRSHARLAFDAIKITEPGSIYIWVSNESGNTRVWFDDLKVSRSTSIVVQATDYGVWGDVLREQQSEDRAYKFGYQGQFAERDEQTGWNHFELREYNPIIGRWTATDPYGQYWSLYIGMGNNPVSGVDSDGGFTCSTCPDGAEYDVYRNSNLVYNYDPSVSGDGVFQMLGEVSVSPSFTDNFLRFLSDINPVESADVYIGAVGKTEINLVGGAKVVVPFGGVQLSANTNTGGRADYVTAEQTYANIQKGPLDIRVIPLNGIGTGDYDPGIRALYTVHRGLIAVPLGEVPVPIGEWKLQGDATLNPITDRYTIGARGVAETFSFPGFKKGTSGFRFEVNGGIRLRLKVPEILK
jgi:RHS repeat-associated protein